MRLPGGRYRARIGGHLAVEAVNALRSRIAGRRVVVGVRAQNVLATATLSFYTSIVTAETGTTAYDKLIVELVDASTNAVLQTLVTLSNANKTTNAATYVQRSYSVVAHKGKNVKVRLRSTTDGSLITTFRVEDVSLMANQ